MLRECYRVFTKIIEFVDDVISWMVEEKNIRRIGLIAFILYVAAIVSILVWLWSKF